MLWRGAKALGNQALETGGNIIKDLAVPENRARAKEVALNRVEEGLGNLGTKAYKSITGSGKGKRKAKSKPTKRKAKRGQTGRGGGLRRDTAVSRRAPVSRRAQSGSARRGRRSFAGKDIF